MQALKTAGRTNWPRSAIPCFLALVIALGVPFEAIMIRGGRTDMFNDYVVHGLMWTPAAAALATCLIYRQSLITLGFGFPSPHYTWLGYALPLLYATIAYAFLWTTGLAPPQFGVFEAHARSELGFDGAGVAAGILIASIGVIMACASALGEEIGWRGFLAPALAERLSFPATVLISGVIWASWHFPVLIWGSYNAGGPPLFSILCFSITVMSLSGITAWLRLRSGSLWPAVILHGSHNAFVQVLFDPLTIETGSAGFYATEFGAGLAITSALAFAVLLWRGKATMHDRSRAFAE